MFVRFHRQHESAQIVPKVLPLAQPLKQRVKTSCKFFYCCRRRVSFLSSAHLFSSPSLSPSPSYQTSGRAAQRRHAAPWTSPLYPDPRRFTPYLSTGCLTSILRSDLISSRHRVASELF